MRLAEAKEEKKAEAETAASDGVSDVVDNVGDNVDPGQQPDCDLGLFVFGPLSRRLVWGRSGPIFLVCLQQAVKQFQEFLVCGTCYGYIMTSIPTSSLLFKFLCNLLCKRTGRIMLHALLLG